MIFNYFSLKAGQRSYTWLTITFLLLSFLYCAYPILAQQPHCHSDEILSSYMNSHDLQHEIKDYKNALRSQVSHRSGGSVVELPVVFHIIHRGESIGESSNLLESKVMEQFDILNTDFAYQNTDKSKIPAQFSADAADTEIQFCLAQVDENGQSTTGIIRHELGVIFNVNDIENLVKPQTQWDPEKYINIWIVRMPDPSILGYAYLPTPSNVGSQRDGIVISHTKIGIQSASTRGRTLVHEMGHYLGLLHMWGFEENDCDEDDQISDTPDAFAPNYGCPFHPQLSCGSSDMFMNYMDYVDDNCMFMFTQGQKNIMHGIIENQRASLQNNKDAICGIAVSTQEEVALERSLDFYPNPCSDYINLDIDTDNEIVSYEIYALNGALVQQVDRMYSHANDVLEIPTYNLSNGAYVVRFKTKSGVSVAKRFVKHQD